MNTLKKVMTLTTIDEIKVFSDPYRLKILNCILETDKPMTVKQIGVALGEKPSKVHYHVQKLVAVDILALDHTENINGIIAKYYLPTAEDFIIKVEEKVKKSVNQQEIEGLLGGVLDHAKESFASQIIKVEEYKRHHHIDKLPDNEKINGGISFESIYVTENELKEITSYMSKVFEKYKKCHRDEEVKKCQLLFGYMEEFNKE